MPVRKFRHVGEMEDSSWREPGTPELSRAIRATWEFARRTTRPWFPPGVFKHRSASGADVQRESWAAANFERFRQRRAAVLRGGFDEE